MTQETYELIPGSIASLLYVRQPGLMGESIPCVFMSAEKGVVVGRHGKPLAEYGWPIEVQAQINKHFGTVFSLAHEDWKGKGPSPRAQYCDAAVSWKVEVTKEST